MIILFYYILFPYELPNEALCVDFIIGCGLHAQEERMHISCMRYLLNANVLYYNAGIPTIHVEQIALTIVFVSISSASFTIFSLIDRAIIDWPFYAV